jgi:hypothetical protein
MQRALARALDQFVDRLPMPVRGTEPEAAAASAPGEPAEGTPGGR